jgi:diguanylate cyclase (GGDEF)-like protein
LLKSAVLCFWLLWHAVALAQLSPLTELSEPFSGYAKLVITAPQTTLDKLLALPLADSQDHISLVQYHLILSQCYYNLSYPQKSLQHAQLAVQHASQEQQPWLYHNALITLSNGLEIAGRPAESLLGLNTAIQWAKKHNHQELYLQGIFSRGIISTNLGDYVGALDDFQHAYSLANDDPNSLSKAHVAAMLAQVYEYRHEDNLSIPYFEEAVAAHRLNNADFDLSIALFGLGRANRSIGQLELGKQQLLESKVLAAKVEDIQGVAYALKELADIEVSEKNYLPAEHQFLEAGDIFKQAENHQMSYNVSIALVKMSLETKQMDKAQAYLQQAKAYLERFNMPIHSIGFDEIHASLLYQQQDFQSAYDELTKAFATYRQYQNTNSTERLHELRSRFEVQLTQQENEVLAQKNAIQKLQINNEKSEKVQLLLITAFISIACLLLVLTIYRSKAYKQELERLVSIDELTGLYNRRHTLALLDQQIKLASRHQKGLCIAMVDLDWFKQINDSFGHLVGDKVLKEFALVFRQGLRSSDVIGRIGGEEFLLILNYSSCDDAYAVLTSLASNLSHIGQKVGEPKVDLTISAGLVALQPHDTVESIMALADTVLYRAKDRGRAQVVIADRVEDGQSPAIIQSVQ